MNTKLYFGGTPVVYDFFVVLAKTGNDAARDTALIYRGAIIYLPGMMPAWARP